MTRISPTSYWKRKASPWCTVRRSGCRPSSGFPTPPRTRSWKTPAAGFSASAAICAEAGKSFGNPETGSYCQAGALICILRAVRIRAHYDRHHPGRNLSSVLCGREACPPGGRAPFRLSLWAGDGFHAAGRMFDPRLRGYSAAFAQGDFSLAAGRADHCADDRDQPAALRAFLSDVLSQLPAEGVRLLRAQLAPSLHFCRAGCTRSVDRVSRRHDDDRQRPGARLWRQPDVPHRRLALRQTGLRHPDGGLGAEAPDVLRTGEMAPAGQWLCVLGGGVAGGQPRNLETQSVSRPHLFLDPVPKFRLLRFRGDRGGDECRRPERARDAL